MAQVCTETQSLYIYEWDQTAELCTSWVSIETAFSVDTASVGAVLGTIVGSAVVLWLLGLSIGKIGHLIEDALGSNGIKGFDP